MENAPLASTRLAGTGNNCTVNSNSVNIITVNTLRMWVGASDIVVTSPHFLDVFRFCLRSIVPKKFKATVTSTACLMMKRFIRRACIQFINLSESFRFVQQNQSTIFCVRCGTPRGIITHWLRSETHRDMAAWARSLVQGTHNAINYQREFSFRCIYQVRKSLVFLSEASATKCTVCIRTEIT